MTTLYDLIKENLPNAQIVEKDGVSYVLPMYWRKESRKAQSKRGWYYMTHGKVTYISDAPIFWSFRDVGDSEIMDYECKSYDEMAEWAFERALDLCDGYPQHQEFDAILYTYNSQDEIEVLHEECIEFERWELA